MIFKGKGFMQRFKTSYEFPLYLDFQLITEASFVGWT